MTSTNPAEDLAFIRRIMDESRSFAEVGGMHFVNWGSVTGFGMFATWGIAAGHLPGNGRVIWGLWVAALAAGFALAYLQGRKERSAPVRHAVNRQIGAVWFAATMPMLLLFFVGQSFELIPPRAIPSIAAALLGTGIYLTGTLAKIGWLRNLAFAWWVASIGLMLVRGASVFLMYGLLIFALYVVPGFKLNQMAKRAGA